MSSADHDQSGSARPRRVVVTSPRMRAFRHEPRRVTREIDEQTTVGEIYVRSLVRTQRRLALLVLAAVGVLVLGLPLLFYWSPAFAAIRLAGVPLAWILLGALAYPLLLAAGWFYVRQAERNERDFTFLVEAAGPGEAKGRDETGGRGTAGGPVTEPGTSSADGSTNDSDESDGGENR